MAGQKLSKAEAELYDRQIRLWGIESQEKLRVANVLLINVRALGSEIAKDILLSGINSLTILDNGKVSKEEYARNFLLSKDSIGSNIAEAVLMKAQPLNPLVKLVGDTDDIDDKNDDFFKSFTLVLGTKLNPKQILRIGKICRKNNIKFIFGDNFGMFGYSASDFQKHTYIEERVQYTEVEKSKKRTHDGKNIEVKREKITVKITDTYEYPEIEKIITIPQETVKAKRRNVYYYLMLALLEFRNRFNRDPEIDTKNADIDALKTIICEILSIYQVAPEKFNLNVLELIFGEIVPVCSVVGGVIAQEIIKAVSGKEVPINNVFLFDPITYSGKEEKVF